MILNKPNIFKVHIIIKDTKFLNGFEAGVGRAAKVVVTDASIGVTIDVVRE